ncbi:MAG: lipoprotein [Candidatus Kapaibacterium sp.]
MKKIIIILSILIALAGCSPDQYTLHRRTGNFTYGMIMSDLESVELIADNALLIKPGGLSAIRRPGMTQNVGDFTVELRSGSGIRIAFRTVRYEYKRQPSMALDYTRSGCIISHDGEVVANIDSVRARMGEPSRIRIINDGKYVKIYIDCDEVLYTTTRLPATEYFIFESIDGGEAVISGIEIAEISDESFEEVL